MIDLRHHEPRERLPLLEMTLDVLQPGELLELVFERWPDALERYLREHYSGRLEWWLVGRHDEWERIGIRLLR